MKKGFTIIEVSLVLAIAGLIFIMVFIALPGLRASQRDTSRRENVMSFLDKVKDFQRNNRGALPTGTGLIEWNKDWNDETAPGATWTGFYRNYLDVNKFEDPSGAYYRLSVMECGSNAVGEECISFKDSFISPATYDNVQFPNDYTMYVVTHATCGGSGLPVVSNNPRKIAVLYKLEGAGFYCNNT